jgi:hypothetical protein
MTAGAAGEPLYGREHELQVVADLVGGLDEVQVALAQHKARPMPEFDRFARIARRLLGRVT